MNSNHNLSTIMGKHFLLFLISLLIFSFSSHAQNNSFSCPIDFKYVDTFPWDTSVCTTVAASANDTKICCTALRSLFGIGLSHYLKVTNTFYFTNLETSTSCIKDFQTHLDLLSVKQSFSKCLEYPTELVDSPANCAGIVTLSDFVDKATPISALESSCKGDLGGDLVCRSCLAAGQEVNARLVPLSRNSSKCFVFISLYAAGVINTFGPEDTRTADCILGVTLSKPKSKSNSSTKNVIFAICGALIGILLVLAVIFIYMRFVKKRKESQPHRDYVKNVKARVLPNMGAKWFSIAELDEATNGFSQQNFLGQGGFGVVYKGTLEDGTVVAVKKMISFDSETDNDFVNEAEIISKIRHRNLLALRGFCATSDPVDGNERYLVYDFMPNGSLHDHIFEKKTKKGLSWPQRKSIILDVANGLSYLHNGIKPAIYHRDIKATNILLDSNMKALVADFGLAKQSGGEGQTHMTTRVAGTYGYVAPEYALYGQLTEKSDVYSFGIIVLEIMTGRRVLEEVKGVYSGMVLIADWVWDMVRSNRIDEVYDSSMNEGTLPKSVMSRFIRVGLLCAHSMVALRPTISQALRMLEGDIDIPRLLDRPPPLGDSSRSSFHDSNGFMWSGSEGSMASSSRNTRVRVQNQ